jgi:hypothetical protein
MTRVSAYAAVIAFLVSLCAAAAPESINYQGYLMQDGVVVNGTKSMSFTLYGAASGGAALCTSGAQSITVTKGLFSYKIGETGCNLTAIDWSNAVYLEVSVDGVAMSPREQVSGMSYLLQKQAADVAFTPTGAVAATTVQAAIAELDSEKLAKAGDTMTGPLAVQGGISASGNITAATGTITAQAFAGDGSALTGISAAALDHNTLGNLTTGDPHTQYFNLSQAETVTGALTVASSITVSGNITAATGTITAQAFAGDGSSLTGVGSAAVADNSLAAGDLAVNVVSSVDGVTNDGGNVDLVAGAGVTITPDDTANTITIAGDFSAVDHGAITGLGDDDHPQYFNLSQAETVTGALTVASSITVSGNITAATGTLTAQAFTGDGSALTGVGSAAVADNSLAAGDLAVNVVSSVDGVTNDGGDIDLVAGAGVTITPDDTANTITIAGDFSAVDHGTITGLGDDDHTQYVKDAGDTMSGPLSINFNTATSALSIVNAGGGNAITASGTVTVGSNSGTDGHDVNFYGTYSSVTGSRMFWDASKSSFRAGRAAGAQWDDGNVGEYSIAMGESTTASGWQATAMGKDTTASGGRSTAMGDITTASGVQSTAMGWGTVASGQASLATGWDSQASGNVSVVMGQNVYATGWHSLAQGKWVTAGANNAIALGLGVSSGLTMYNGTASSFAVGFNSDLPTLFVGPASGVGTYGKVGIGTTAPANRLDVEGGAAIGATYSGTSAAPANGLIVEGKVGIGTATPGAVGAAKLELYGTAGSTAGPHIQVVTSSDTYPVFQQLNYGHDNIALNFDTYYDGTNWRSSDAGSNFALYKNNDKMKLAYKSGVAAGGVISFDSGIVLLASNGNVGIGTDTPANKLHVENSSATGNGAYFYTSNAANTTGQTVYALNAGGTSSRAGYFENSNPANTACSLWANNTGGGEALCGSLNNPTSTSDAIKISTDGDGRAASFTVTKATSTNDTVYISHAGIGSGSTAALEAVTTNGAHAIYGHTSGTTGRAGKFIIENPANDNDVLYLETASNVGGTTLGRLIDTDKGAYLTNTGIWTDASSRQYKKDITPLTPDDVREMLDVVKGIEVVRYRYKDESPDQKMTLGVIAEDAPDEMTDDTKTGVQTVKAVGMLIAAVQAQQQLIEDLQREIENLKKTQEELKGK